MNQNTTPSGSLPHRQGNFESLVRQIGERNEIGVGKKHLEIPKGTRKRRSETDLRQAEETKKGRADRDRDESKQTNETIEVDEDGTFEDASFPGCKSLIERLRRDRQRREKVGKEEKGWVQNWTLKFCCSCNISARFERSGSTCQICG